MPERFKDGQIPITSTEARALQQAIRNSTLLTKREFVDVKLAPVFHPTEDEFADPVKYIATLRSVGTKSGIIKIVPPKGWNPPPCMNQCFQGAQRKPFPTKRQSVHRLQEGAHYADGKKYHIDDFRVMANKFRAHILAKMAGHESVWPADGTKAAANEEEALSLDAHNIGSNASGRKNINLASVSHASVPADTGSADTSIDADKTIGAPVLASDSSLLQKGSGTDERSATASSVTPDASDDDNAAASKDSSPAVVVVSKGLAAGTPSEASAGAPPRVPTDVPEPSLLALEEEYWRIVETNSQKVDVDYGSDLDTIIFGSGFPIAKKDNAAITASASASSSPYTATGANNSVARSNTDDKASSSEAKPTSASESDSRVPCDFGNPSFYEKTGWNLNNLPHYPGSVLRHIQGNYNGINVPWLYVGMLFGTFAWHNEDNYLYSISYNHTGAPKVWYGVPGKHATKLEETLRAFLMNRFREVPDLVYHLVTMIGPSILLNKGIDVCKAYQEPGTFMVTFPQAFHGGFSTGFNVGEAVNFALPDWLVHGQQCAERYRSWARSSPISRERLVMAMARNLDDLDLNGCILLANDIKRLRDEQDLLRRGVHEAGVHHACRMPNENPDDEEFDEKRLCSICQHLCYFSCVVCSCDSDRVVCLRHHNSLCQCNRRENCFLFWYTVKEMDAALETVQNHVLALQSGKVGGGTREALPKKMS
jgi:histone demethylase JARID1